MLFRPLCGIRFFLSPQLLDLLFQSSASSLAAVWYLSNGAFAGGATLSTALPSGFKIVGPR